MFICIEVADRKTEEAFIELPVRLYRGNPYWIRPLNDDICKVFDREKNPCFREGGECVRWLLRNEEGEYVGRVAAFVNKKTCGLDKYTVGQMGFFECIDDRQAAFMLFDKCREWLEERGMEAMEGPVNFGERIEWWGLLVDGYDECPVYAMPYTKPYYVRFFEEYGFRDYFKQFTYRTRLVMESLSKIVVWKADRILQNPDYSVRTYGDIGKQKAIDALLTVYNKAWNLEVHGVDGITREQVEALYRSLRPIIDKELIYFAFYQDEPIGFFLMFPEINQAVRHLNGKMNVWGILRFMYHLKVKKIKVALGQLFGVVPEFQGKGVEAAMIKRFTERIIEDGHKYDYLELNWIGDFNPPMIHLMEYIGAKTVRTHITYRKLFRDDIPFTRSVDKVTGS
ncbi:hypothetical protein [Odoribacter sp. Z80]|uniref:hypothetical protein n=1 Tax=Odoribacter sp. Z80 TaxID=2304575 RepID=UPI00137A4A83|nr:hypothetical protein [Odoribacter sp. Z80]NCE72313.1 hypothetical protein [Odoribacter sp. Z80]